MPQPQAPGRLVSDPFVAELLVLGYLADGLLDLTFEPIHLAVELVLVHETSATFLSRSGPSSIIPGMKFKRFGLASCLALGFATAPSAAQSSLDPQINEKIRREEAANSQIMKTLHHLADVYGPRLTG